MSYTVIWVENNMQFCLPYSTYCDAAEHAAWLLRQGFSAYVDIEEMN